MPKSLFTLALLGLLFSTSNTEAQKPLDAPSSISTGENVIATARHGADLVAGGYRTIEYSSCRPAQQAFLTDASAGEGSEVDLFAGLQSLDFRHIMASAVSAIDIDRSTGERVVAVDVLLGWDAAEDPGKVSTAQGVLVLRFSPSGLLLRDAYLGSLPSGPPPTALCQARSQLPPASAFAATSVRVDQHGEILLRGRSLPRASLHEDLIRMNSDLEVMGSSAEPREQFGCPSPISPSNLISLKELPGTYLDGEASDLFRDDSCALNITPIGHEFGIETGYQADLPPEAATIHVDLNFFDGTIAPVEFQLKNNNGVWVTVARRQPDRFGKIADSIVIDDTNGYIHNATRVFLRLLILPAVATQGGDSLSAAPTAREDIDIDVLQMELEP